MESEDNLPNTSETLVTLAHPDAGNPDKDFTPTRLHLVHVSDPRSSTFSTKKKQCDLWEYVWGSSVLLGGLLSLIDMSKLNAIEIGGGQGLCSMAAAKSGASVLMTDLVLDATKLAEKSAKMNGLSEKLNFRSLNWDKLETVPEEEFDVVIASDVLFGGWTTSPVSKTIARALKPGGIALLADPCRLNVGDFIDRIESLGLGTELFIFKDELLQTPREHASGDTAFVDIKRAKLVVIRKKDSNTTTQDENKSIKTFAKSLAELLPRFTDTAEP